MCAVLSTIAMTSSFASMFFKKRCPVVAESLKSVTKSCGTALACQRMGVPPCYINMCVSNNSDAMKYLFTKYAEPLMIKINKKWPKGHKKIISNKQIAESVKDAAPKEFNKII